ncbi:MAG: PolyA polymerase [Parcubacteria group bacterium GW2011_GWE2_37_8]|nr:MAG: PolyA polymerase [Parcubacteria group bacterium GW2011_GWE2_37_8]
MGLNKNFQIPQEVLKILNAFKAANFEAYIVGGCVRDILLGREPKDWDVVTNAEPGEIQNIFPNNFYENQFGTVGIITGSQTENLKVVEATTYRIDGQYSDMRHPDEVKFAKTIKEDLARRDFTVNSMALSLVEGMAPEFIDLFGGQEDLKNKIIKAVGEPEKRFQEDALRMMRAMRFLAQFSIPEGTDKNGDWKIEEKTAKAIEKNKKLIEAISKERIRDEFLKIIDSSNPCYGIEIMRRLGLLKYVLPELESAYGVGQNKHHIYDVYEHSIKSLAFAVKKKYSQDVKIAALLHDIGKPDTKHGEGSSSTFYNHEVVGAKIAERILNRLKFSKKQIEKLVILVRYHLFYYNVDEVTESSVRRLVRKVGPENMNELIQIRTCDRIGSGVPKAEPYKLRHLKYIIDKVSRDPISPKMLLAKGEDVMRILNISPGPKIGMVLEILLDEVLDDPARNTKQNLELRIKNLGKLSDDEIKKLSERAEKKKEEIQMKIEDTTKKKYWVT